MSQVRASGDSSSSTSDPFRGLISPRTRKPLLAQGDHLVTQDGSERYPLLRGVGGAVVAQLVDADAVDAHVRHEQEVFDALDLHGLAYFRPALFLAMIDRVMPTLGGRSPRAVVELGGGEGFMAAHWMRRFPRCSAYVCDLSDASLSRAVEGLIPLCADASRPLFEPDSLDVALFWVSLHHLNPDQVKAALAEVVTALRPGGVLVVFEPNAGFYPRSVMYNTALAGDVYVDDDEQAVNFHRLEQQVSAAGLIPVDRWFLNPPYNLAFVKKLRRWPIYWGGVELLHWFDKICLRALGSESLGLKGWWPHRFTLYGGALFQKSAVGGGTSEEGGA